MNALSCELSTSIPIQTLSLHFRQPDLWLLMWREQVPTHNRNVHLQQQTSVEYHHRTATIITITKIGTSIFSEDSVHGMHILSAWHTQEYIDNEMSCECFSLSPSYKGRKWSLQKFRNVPRSHYREKQGVKSNLHLVWQHNFWMNCC